jgi:hypothetical protein
MTEHEQDRVQQLFKAAVPMVGRAGDKELRRDLWPAMLTRLEARRVTVSWFDWALLAAVAMGLLFSPAAIPLVLSYL